MNSNQQSFQRSRFRAVRHLVATVTLPLGLLSATMLNAATFIGGPENYRALLKELRAGDTLLLQPGLYQRGLPIHHLLGEAGKPILITGIEHLSRPRFVARSGYNTVSIVDSAHVTLRDLELDGRGLPVDGVKAEGHAHWAHHIRLENLVIKGHGNNQQTVGISTKCLAWNWTIRNNVVLGAGTGMYLGDSDGDKPFIAGLIEHNLIVDSTGYNLQIKHQHRQPEIPGEPAVHRSTIIRHNLFSKSELPAEEGMARPNLLVGHWPRHGPGSQDRYLIYGNLFYRNPSEALFQGEGNLALYSNLFVNPLGDAVHIQPHNDVPKQVDIFNNTVVASGAGILIRQKQGEQHFTQHVVANLVFAMPDILGGEQRANLTGSFAAAGNYLTAPYAAVDGLDLFPRVDNSTGGVSDSAGFTDYPDWNLDFNGNRRIGGNPGAYSGSGQNPGWQLKLERKP